MRRRRYLRLNRSRVQFIDKVDAYPQRFLDPGIFEVQTFSATKVLSFIKTK